MGLELLGALFLFFTALCGTTEQAPATPPDPPAIIAEAEVESEADAEDTTATATTTTAKSTKSASAPKAKTPKVICHNWYMTDSGVHLREISVPYRIFVLLETALKTPEELSSDLLVTNGVEDSVISAFDESSDKRKLVVDYCIAELDNCTVTAEISTDQISYQDMKPKGEEAFTLNDNILSVICSQYNYAALYPTEASIICEYPTHYTFRIVK